MNELLYIGQTTNLQRRLNEHYQNYIFKKVSYQVVEDKGSALDLEAFLISTLKPHGNKQCTQRRVVTGAKIHKDVEVWNNFDTLEFEYYHTWFFSRVLSEVEGSTSLKDCLKGSFKNYNGECYQGLEIIGQLYVGLYITDSGMVIATINCGDVILLEKLLQIFQQEGITYYKVNGNKKIKLPK